MIFLFWKNVLLVLNGFYICVKILASPWSQKKREGHNQILTFACIELHCLNLDAIDKILSAVRYLLSRKIVRLNELQSLIGLLNCTCSVITPLQSLLSLFQWEVLFRRGSLVYLLLPQMPHNLAGTASSLASTM